jgi:phenylalanyl-tRNA synthetase beta chain
MKVPVSWLRELCPTELSAEELAELLTSKGAEVEGIERPWAGLDDVLTARVLEVRDHPNSEKLCLARVDAGPAVGELEVVVGVRNMVAGDVVPFARPGSRVPALPEPLGRREIRGVTSNGMLCSPKELAISADHGAILVLPDDTAVGEDVARLFGLDDAVLDVAVTPNRPDLLSVAGVAREVAAATGAPFAPPSTAIAAEADEKAADLATVEILDLDRCPRYLARVIRGVTVGPSPVRAQARLTAAGMRPLSNVVDATNYVLLELGHPLHPFDLEFLAGSAIVVRRAEEGEHMVTLDDVERELSSEDLVIADRERAVAVAGVMGSAAAEVSPDTRDVLLESAYFERTGVARTSRRLKLSSEASRRFERGADPEAVPRAADRSAALIAEWAGGTVLAGSIDVGGAPERRRVRVRPSRAAVVLGRPVEARDVTESLARIGIPAAEPAEADGPVEAEIPGFRPDLEREIDLIEEVIRVQGYDRLGETLPPVRQSGGEPASRVFRRRVRDALVRAGLRETTSYSFASQADLDLTGDRDAVGVANPLAADDAHLRTSLLPGMLRAVEVNRRHGVRTVRLFEVGRVFFPPGPEAAAGDSAVEECERVALALAGPASGGYPDPARDLDATDAKGAVESLLELLGLDWELGGPPSRRLFHPGRSASVLVDGELVGEVGELHPRVAGLLGLPDRVALAELDVDVLARHAARAFRYADVPRLPPIHRDLAFVLDDDIPAAEVRAAVVDAAAGLATAVTLFDVFAGGGIEPGKRSLAFAVEFRAPDRTLAGEEADRAVEAIRRRLADDFGAELRAG